MTRVLTALLAVALTLPLAACDPKRDLDGPLRNEFGEFRLGHNVVIARDPTVGPASRKASEEEWQFHMKRAIDNRFGRYEGDRLYHLGVSVDGYILALIDVPLVPTPKSLLIITASIWDDAKGVKLNEDAEQLTVVGTLLSGGSIQPSKREQLDNLSELAAKEIQDWLLRNPQWFEEPADAPAPAASAAAAEAAEAPAEPATN